MSSANLKRNSCGKFICLRLFLFGLMRRMPRPFYFLKCIILGFVVAYRVGIGVSRFRCTGVRFAKYSYKGYWQWTRRLKPPSMAVSPKIALRGNFPLILSRILSKSNTLPKSSGHTYTYPICNLHRGNDTWRFRLNVYFENTLHNQTDVAFYIQ